MRSPIFHISHPATWSDSKMISYGMQPPNSTKPTSRDKDTRPDPWLLQLDTLSGSGVMPLESLPPDNEQPRFRGIMAATCHLPSSKYSSWARCGSRPARRWTTTFGVVQGSTADPAPHGPLCCPGNHGVYPQAYSKHGIPEAASSGSSMRKPDPDTGRGSEAARRAGYQAVRKARAGLHTGPSCRGDGGPNMQ